MPTMIAARLHAYGSPMTLDLSVLEHRISPLSQVNGVLASMDNRDGGFTNFVIRPDTGWTRSGRGG